MREAPSGHRDRSLPSNIQPNPPEGVARMVGVSAVVVVCSVCARCMRVYTCNEA